MCELIYLPALPSTPDTFLYSSTPPAALAAIMLTLLCKYCPKQQVCIVPCALAACDEIRLLKVSASLPLELGCNRTSRCLPLSEWHVSFCHRLRIGHKMKWECCHGRHTWSLNAYLNVETWQRKFESF